MSVVTNVMIAFSVSEDVPDNALPPMVKRMNQWLSEHNHNALNDIARHFGGEKYAEVQVWAGAFNYLHRDEFVAMVRGLPWNEPDCVQIFIQDQEEETFTLR